MTMRRLIKGMIIVLVAAIVSSCASSSGNEDVDNPFVDEQPSINPNLGTW